MVFDRRETGILLVGDFLILSLSLWAALAIRNLAVPAWGYFQDNLLPFLPMFAISLMVFYVAGLYEKQTRPIRRVMGVRILGAQATTVAVAAILFFVLPLTIAPKTILIIYLGVSVVAESLWRFYRMSHELKTEERTSAVIIGSGQAVLELYEEVRENPRYLMHFVDHIDTAVETNPIVVTVKRMVASGIRALVLDFSDPRIAKELPELSAVMAEGVAISDFATLYEEIFDRVPVGHLDPMRLLESLPKERTVYDAAKRVFDIVLALVGIVIAVPFVGMAVVVSSMQGGAPFVHQKRVGKGERVFSLVKLRSMLFDDNGDPELHAKNRVTPFGKFLRKTRIDELPQLWNVLKGDVSFIGPRPEIPEIVARYEQEIPQYRSRHLIVPGISGWAQIHDYDAPHGPADVVRTRRKLSFDLYYLKHRSFGLDLAIAIKSVRALLAFSGT